MMRWRRQGRKGFTDQVGSVARKQSAGTVGLRAKIAQTVLALVCFYVVLAILLPSSSHAVDIQLNPGLNLFSYPTVPEDNLTCSQLQADFGADRIMRLDSQGQVFQDCESFDFPILAGEGYTVDVLAGATISIDGEFSCPEIDLTAGVNLVGVPTPIPGLTCFDLLNLVGDVSGSAIQRFNIQTGLFETCSMDFDNTVPSGNNFSIMSGEGYLVHMKNGLSGFNINELAKCTPFVELSCQSMSPTQGPVGATVTLRGTGFIASSTQVSFNGLAAVVINQTETRLDVQVPAGNASGPVVIDRSTDGSNVQCGDFTLNGAPTLDPIGNRTVLLGQQTMFNVSGSDPDNDPLTFTVAPLPLPLGAVFDVTSKEFTFRPVVQQADQCFSLTFAVSDGQLESSETIDLCVESAQQTTLNGSVLSTTDLCPLEGVTVAGGLDSGPQATATTDVNGLFTLLLDDVPTDAAGLTPLKIDATAPNVVRHCPEGDTAFNQGPDPDLPLIREAVRLLPDAANLINCEPDRLCINGERPILMPVLAIAEGTMIDPTQDQMVQSPVVGICEADNLGFSKRCDINGDAAAQCGVGKACIPTNTIELAVESGSALDATTCTNPNDNSTCQPFTGTMSLTPVPNDRSPIELPDEFDFSVYMAVQPFNVKFDPPQPICFPNVENFPSGSKLDVFAMDSDSGEFIQLGTATVCGPTGDPNIPTSTNPMCPADNSMMCSDGGIVRFGSWHGTVPVDPKEEEDAAEDDTPVGDGADPGDEGLSPGDNSDSPTNVDCGFFGEQESKRSSGESADAGPGSSVCMRSGDLSVDHNTVSYQSHGINRSVRLTYHSQHAFPNPFISKFWTPGNTAPPPVNMSTRVKIGGVEVEGENFYSTDFCTRQSCPFGRFARAVDASAFVTGIYPAELDLQCNFPVSRRLETHTSTVSVINERDSSIGAGWSIDGLEKIHRAVTGDLMVTDGDASPLIFTPALRVSSAISRTGEQDTFQFAANRGDLITLRMRRNSNLPDGTSSLDPFIELRDSRGFLVAQDDDSGETLVEGIGKNALIASLDLPSSDTYSVILRGVGGTTGDYDLFVTSATDTPIIEGVLGSIEDLQQEISFAGDVPLGGETTHTFAASIGTRVSISVDREANLPDNSGTLDPVIELRNSQGFLVAGDDDSGGDSPPGPGRNALIPSLTLPATDTYSIVVMGSSGSAGPYNGRIIFGNVSGSIEIADSGTTSFDEVLLTPTGEFSVLKENPDGTFQRRMKHGTLKRYDDNGRLTEIEDRNGNTTQYAYDTGGRLVSITDPVALVTTFRYNADTGSAFGCSQNLDEIEDPAGRITQLVHDAECNLVEIINPDGSRRGFAYDENHLMTDKTSPRGMLTESDTDFVTRYEFDDFGRAARSFRPDGVMRQYQSGQSQGLHKAPSVCDPLSPVLGCPANLLSVLAVTDIDTSYTDGRGETVSLGELNSLGLSETKTDAMGRTTAFQRSAAGLITQLVRPNNSIQTRTYDQQANLLSVTEEFNGATNRFSYDPVFHLLTRVTDAEGNTSEIKYDPQGNPVESIDPFGTRSINVYADPNCPGQITRTTQAAGLSIEATSMLEYDTKCNLQRLVDPEGNITEMQYDTAGNLVAIVEGVGTSVQRANQFSYDALNRLLTITDGEGNVTTLDYDVSGNLVSAESPTRETQQRIYDQRNRLVEIIDPITGSSIFTYDNEGNLLTTTNAENATTQFFYDLVGRLERSLDAENGERLFAYDVMDNLTTVTDANGHTTTFEYDVLNRTKRRINPLNQFKQFFYDSRNNLIRQIDAKNQETTFGYDALSRLTKLNLPDDVLELDYDVLSRVNRVADNDSEVEFSFDRLGRTVTAATTAAGVQPQVTLTNDYDAVSQRRSVADSLGGLTQFNYDQAGRMTQVTTPSGQPIGLSYDAASRFQQIGFPNAVASDFVYDIKGRLETLTYTANSGVSVLERFTYQYNNVGSITQIAELGQTRNFTYDKLQQVTSGGTATQPESYNYGLEGNRIDSHLSSLHTVNDANRLLEDDAFSYTYDANGNLETRIEKLSGDVTTYSYNTQNQLVRVDQPDGKLVTYAYDGLGRRTEKNVDGVITRYVYDGENIVLEFDGGDNLTTRYTHGPGRDQPLSLERGGHGFFYQADHIGSIRQLTNAAGSVVNQYTYDSFGNRQSVVEAVSQPYSFTGRELDSETGLYYYRARHYDPTIGRFLQMDIAGFQGDSTNLYKYVDNSPNNFRDPNGLFPIPRTPIGGGKFVSGSVGLNGFQITGSQEKSSSFGFRTFFLRFDLSVLVDLAITDSKGCALRVRVNDFRIRSVLVPLLSQKGILKLILIPKRNVRFGLLGLQGILSIPNVQEEVKRKVIQFAKFVANGGLGKSTPGANGVIVIERFP